MPDRADSEFGEKGKATKKPTDPLVGSLGSSLDQEEGDQEYDKDQPSLPDKDSARRESLGEGSSIGLEKGVDKWSNARGGCKNQEQSKE